LFFLSFITPSPHSTPNPAPAPPTDEPDGPVQSSVSAQGLDKIDTLAAHDASQLACSFQDAFDGGESSWIEDDIDDAGANAPDGQDDDEPLVHASGKYRDLCAQPFTDCQHRCQASAWMQSTLRVHGSVCMFSWKLECQLMVIARLMNLS
jgi:hypothetical protein